MILEMAKTGVRNLAANPLRSLLSAREPIYSQAQLIVDTGSLGPDEIAQLVEQELDELE